MVVRKSYSNSSSLWVFGNHICIYYVHTHTCMCINDNDDKINQQYIRMMINITRYIYRYIYVYRYRPCHRMLIAKDQPCSACIVKHGFSNQTGFVRHSSRSDRAPCKRTVKTYKRTRTTRRSCRRDSVAYHSVENLDFYLNRYSSRLIFSFFAVSSQEYTQLPHVVNFSDPFPPKCQFFVSVSRCLSLTFFNVSLFSKDRSGYCHK